MCTIQTAVLLLVDITVIVNNNNKTIYNGRITHESEARASHQVARRSVLIVNELGYEMRL